MKNKKTLFGWLAGIGAGLLLLSKGKEVVDYGLSVEQEHFISELNPAFQNKFRSLIKAFTDKGWRIIVTSGFRPLDLSKYAHGDYHNYGMALDINAEKGSTYLRMASPKSAWIDSGLPAVAQSMGLRWGGNFVSTPYDPVHFDAGNDYSTPALYAMYQNSGLPSNKLNLTL